MLTELQIKNFAIIEQERIIFGPGLNVISGETGAGKSIILNALLLILGARSKSHFIRQGADALEIEALFDLSGLESELKATLPEIVKAEEQIAISRRVSSQGQNRIYINGHLASLNLLKQISVNLINICGQSEYVALSDSNFHLALLDDFASNNELLTSFSKTYSEWRDGKKRLEELQVDAKEKEKRLLELQEFVSELAALNLRPGVKASLEEEVARLSNSERLIKKSDEIAGLFAADDGILSRMNQIRNELCDLCRLDKGLSPVLALFESAKTELLEFERDLSGYVSRITSDEERLDTLSQNLSDIVRVERKYKTDEAGLLDLYSSARIELDQATDVEHIQRLRKEVSKLELELNEIAERLSKKRKGAIAALAKLVETELAELNMKGCRFVVEVNSSELGPFGFDSVQFLISANAGQAPRALSLVASGGELSRIMLVLKKVLRDRLAINILVFDEVDTGVSGKVARAMGKKLKELARSSQVICVTHLAQVASLADRHLLVEKSNEGHAKALVKELNEEQRILEIARMLAGYKITAASLESARELMDSGA